MWFRLAAMSLCARLHVHRRGSLAGRTVHVIPPSPEVVVLGLHSGNAGTPERWNTKGPDSRARTTRARRAGRMTLSTPTDPQMDAEPAASSDPRTTSEVLASLIAGVQALVKKELELAKLELRKVLVEKAVALGLGMFGALLLVFVLAFLGVTGAAALQQVVAPWISWAIVTGVYLLLAAIVLAVATKLAKRSVVPERTKTSLEQTVTWAKEQV